MKKLLTKLFTVAMSVLLLFSVTACAEPKKDVSIKYYAEASDLIPALKQGAQTIGILPEPAVSKLTKVVATDYSVKLSVQTLYGGDYPQAVIVAKKSVIESDANFVKAMMNGLATGNEWLKNNIADGVNAINAHLEQGVTASLSAEVIDANTIDRCNIYFESATDAKADINAYISDILAVEESAVKTVSNDFFYDGTGETSLPETNGYTVVAPDGAPALALAQAIATNKGFGVKNDDAMTYKIVSASTIATYVKNPDATRLADFVILPVNAATKLVGDASIYKMLGVVTHGNLYIVSNQEINTVNDLKGKTIGCFQQGNVPDLMLRCVLKKNNITFAQI